MKPGLKTIYNDDTLRKKVAWLWSEMNSAEVTPAMITAPAVETTGASYPDVNRSVRFAGAP